jgi:hypothetical protein
MYKTRYRNMTITNSRPSGGCEKPSTRTEIIQSNTEYHNSPTSPMKTQERSISSTPYFFPSAWAGDAAAAGAASPFGIASPVLQQLSNCTRKDKHELSNCTRKDKHAKNGYTSSLNWRVGGIFGSISCVLRSIKSLIKSEQQYQPLIMAQAKHGMLQESKLDL